MENNFIDLVLQQREIYHSIMRQYHGLPAVETRTVASSKMLLEYIRCLWSQFPPLHRPLESAASDNDLNSFYFIDGGFAYHEITYLDIDAALEEALSVFMASTSTPNAFSTSSFSYRAALDPMVNIIDGTLIATVSNLWLLTMRLSITSRDCIT